jgi:hypothetical protein
MGTSGKVQSNRLLAACGRTRQEMQYARHLVNYAKYRSGRAL